MQFTLYNYGVSLPDAFISFYITSLNKLLTFKKLGRFVSGINFLPFYLKFCNMHTYRFCLFTL